MGKEVVPNVTLAFACEVAVWGMYYVPAKTWLPALADAATPWGRFALVVLEVKILLFLSQDSPTDFICVGFRGSRTPGTWTSVWPLISYVALPSRGHLDSMPMATLLQPTRFCFHSGAAQSIRPAVTRITTSTTNSSSYYLFALVSRFFSSGLLFRPVIRPQYRLIQGSLRRAVPFRKHNSWLEKYKQPFIVENWTKWLFKQGPASIITEYQRLPPEYTDAGGVDFREKELNVGEIRTLFGAGMSVQDGNQLLRIIHGRRVAGTLDHPEYFHRTRKYGERAIQLALAWLRRSIPVDEVMNAALRAEDELVEIEMQKLEKHGRKEKAVSGKAQHKTKIPGMAASSKGDSPEHKGQACEHSAQADFVPDPTYGHSTLDELRFKNQQAAKIDARENARKMEEFRRRRLKSHGVEDSQITEVLALDPDRVHLPELPKKMSARMQEHYEKGMSKLEKPPEVTHKQRFTGPYLLSAVALALAFIANQVYEPPREHERMFPSLPFAVPAVLSLVAINFVVFAAWKRPQWWGFMNKHFVLSPAVPVPTQVLMCAVSHQKFGHLFANMLALVLVGVPLCDTMGKADFMALVVTSALIGNLSSLTFFALTKNFHVATQGFSAVVCAIIMTYFWIYRSELFTLGIPTVLGLEQDARVGIPGWAFLTFHLLYNLFLVRHWVKASVDFANHWGGIAVGTAGGLLYEHKQELKRQRRQERNRMRKLAATKEKGKEKRGGSAVSAEEKAFKMVHKVEEAVKANNV